MFELTTLFVEKFPCSSYKCWKSFCWLTRSLVPPFLGAKQVWAFNTLSNTEDKFKSGNCIHRWTIFSEHLHEPSTEEVPGNKHTVKSEGQWPSALVGRLPDCQGFLGSLQLTEQLRIQYTCMIYAIYPYRIHIYHNVLFTWRRSIYLQEDYMTLNGEEKKVSHFNYTENYNMLLVCVLNFWD